MYLLSVNKLSFIMFSPADHVKLLKSMPEKTNRCAVNEAQVTQG